MKQIPAGWACNGTPETQSHCRLMYIAPLLLTQTVLTLSPAKSPTSQQRNRKLLCCVPAAVNITAKQVFTGRLQIALSPLNLHCRPWEGLSHPLGPAQEGAGFSRLLGVRGAAWSCCCVVPQQLVGETRTSYRDVRSDFLNSTSCSRLCLKLSCFLV